MAWVRSEYAGELAVLSAWLAVLLPWNVVVTERIFGGRFLFVRFPLVEVQYGWGHALPELQGFAIRSLPAAYQHQSGEAVGIAYAVWGIGAVAVVTAVGISIVYYLREEQVESAPVDPVRLIGGLLVAAGLAMAASAALFYLRGVQGAPVPAGTVIIFLLGVVLLWIERH